MKTLHNITIPKLSGKKTIAQARIFSYLDSDFKNYGTDKPGKKTEETKFAVCEMTEDATFKQLFTKPEEMAMTQEQILYFLENHRDLLNQDWYNFFLFKIEDEFFVAYVYVHDRGLRVLAYRLSHDDVWDAEPQRRFVVPATCVSDTQDLASRPSESLTPSLEKAIEIVKKEGYLIFKQI